MESSGPKKPLQAAAQILSANKERLRGRLPRLDQAYRRKRRQRGEKFGVARRIELEARTKSQHEFRILPGRTSRTERPGGR